MNDRDKLFLAAVAAVLAGGVGFAATEAKLPHYIFSAAHMENIAKQDLNHGDGKAAFSIFSKLARKGDASAAFYIGVMYQRGEGAPRDGAKAVKWLTVSAKGGDSLAARQLGVLYLDGTDELQDFGKAREWFGVAAKAGDEVALRNLGEMDAQGLGAPADPVKAYAYYSVAATRGGGYAAVLRNDVAKKLDPRQQSEGEKDAEKIFAEIAPMTPAVAPAARKTGGATKEANAPASK